MSRKFQKFSSINMRLNRMRRILHEQNNEEENLPALSQEQFLLGKERGLMLNHGEYSVFDYEVSKKLMYLLRHGQHVHQEEGAVQFWRIRENLQKYFLYCPHWSDRKWKSCMAGGGHKKNIPVLYWLFRNNCVSPSSSRTIQDAILLILHYRTM